MHLCGKYRVLLMWVAVMALVVGAVAQDGCMSATRSAGPVQIDLSPPGTFIDVCAEDATLCRTLTSGYPPSVSTLAYFVPAEEWKTAKEKPQGFSRYLIAQLAGSMSPEKLPGFKRYLHSQQGEIPDSTSLPSFLAAHGRVPLGIVGESADSISFGTVMKLESTQPSSQSLALASINSAIIVRDRVLSRGRALKSPVREVVDVLAAEQSFREIAPPHLLVASSSLLLTPRGQPACC